MLVPIVVALAVLLPSSGEVAHGIGPANIRLNDPLKDVDPHTKQAETSVAACGNTVVAGWIEADMDGATTHSRMGFANSADGGTTWTDRGGVPVSTGGASSGDPVVAADSACNFYYAFIAIGSFTGNPLDDPSTWTVADYFIGVSKSTDGGQTFSAPVNARGSTYPTFGPDKPWIAVDTSASQYTDRVYVCWTDSGTLKFVYSTDGAASFSAPVALASGGFACNMSVDSQGRLYVAWTGSGAFQMVRSDNGGATFLAPVTIATVGGVLGTFETCQDFIGPMGRYTLNGHIRASGMPFLATNPVNGHVYAAWNANLNGNPDIYFSRSLDQGGTWSTPTRVNDDATTTDQFQPAIAVNASGNIAVAWYDRRNDPQNNFSIDVYTGVSVNDGNSFANQRLTDSAFPVPPLKPDPTPATDECTMGDYLGIAHGGSKFHVVWTDGRNMIDSRHDLDPYYAAFADGNPATFIVNSKTSDAPEFAVGDGVCETASGNGICTLRAAIMEANFGPGADTIYFNIGTGLQVITPGSALPAIIYPVTIEGRPQGGFYSPQAISLSGAGAGSGVSGLRLLGGNSIVTGLGITGFSGDGIQIGSSNNSVGGASLVPPVPGNSITSNGGRGVNVYVVSGTNNRIRGNWIYDNGGLGIDLGNDGVTPDDVDDSDTGANNLQNHGTLTSAATSGTLTGFGRSAPNTVYAIDIFASSACDGSGFGEGEQYLGTAQGQSQLTRRVMSGHQASRRSVGTLASL